MNVMPDTPSPTAVLQEVEAVVRSARQAVGEGCLVDLRGLDQRMATLCGLVAASGQRTLRPALERLAAELNGLTGAVALAAGRDGLAGVAGRSADPRARFRAVQAYGTASAADLDDSR
jgi:hypothetical protein